MASSWPVVVSNVVPDGRRRHVHDVLIDLSGSDGVNLWDLYTRKELGYSGTNQDVCGTVTCTTWMKPSRNKATEILCYGTGSGYLIFAQLNTIDVSDREIAMMRQLIPDRNRCRKSVPGDSEPGMKSLAWLGTRHGRKGVLVSLLGCATMSYRFCSSIPTLSFSRYSQADLTVPCQSPSLSWITTKSVSSVCSTEMCK